MSDDMVTTDRINMALSDLIKDTKKKNVNERRTSVKSHKAKTTSVKAQTAKANARTQRVSSINKARGITTSNKPKNVYATNAARGLALKARQRKLVQGKRSVIGTTASKKFLSKRRGGGGASVPTQKAANPNETLKITVQNRGAAGKSSAPSLGSSRRLRLTQVASPRQQARARPTRQERSSALANAYRNETSDRRNNRFLAARGILPISNNNARGGGGRGGSRRITAGNERRGATRLRIGGGGARTAGAAIRNRRIANNAARNNRNPDNSSNNNRNASRNANRNANNRNANNINDNRNNSNYDAYANFRSNRPRNNNNRNDTTNNRNNRNNSTNARNNANNRNNNSYDNYNDDSYAPPRKSSLNDIFRQNNQQQRKGPSRQQQFALGDGNRPGRHVVVRR